MDKIIAPWNDEQVDALNRWQMNKWVHPFTCGPCRDADAYPATDDHPLIATNEGWSCPTCDYTQNWAHTMMVNPIASAWREEHGL